MRLKPRVQLRPMEFSVGIGALESAAGTRRACGRRRRCHCGVREGGRAADGLRFALTSRKIGGVGPNVFVACRTHARTTWSVSRERGLAGHGPWARFGG